MGSYRGSRDYYFIFAFYVHTGYPSPRYGLSTASMYSPYLPTLMSAGSHGGGGGGGGGMPLYTHSSSAVAAPGSAAPPPPSTAVYHRIYDLHKGTHTYSSFAASSFHVFVLHGSLLLLFCCMKFYFDLCFCSLIFLSICLPIIFCVQGTA